MRKTALFLIFISFWVRFLGIDFPSPTPYKYINDYVGIIDKAIAEKIISLGKELEDKSGAQLTTVIIDTIGNMTIEEYAVELFRKWGIGQKGKDNGVLLLVAIKDRQMRIEIGYGLEGAIPDGKAGRIRDEYIIPYFKEGDYSKGVYYGYLALAKEIAKEYNIDLAFDINSQLPATTQNRRPAIEEFIIFVVTLIIVLLILSAGVRYRGPMGPSGPFGPGGFGSSRGFKGSSGGGFGRFGGGRSGGGGASGKW